MVEITCPLCGKVAELITVKYEIPYFNEVLLTSVSCECGFRHSDCVVLGVKDPVRYKLRVKGSNLFTKVVRSTSGTIRVPELGVVVEPGPASQAFITNLEGVLDRIKDVVLMAMRWKTEEGDKKAVVRCEEILKMIENVIEGKNELTLIIEDPFGNSLIASPEAEKENLSVEELKNLKTGLTILDISGMSEEELKNYQQKD